MPCAERVHGGIDGLLNLIINQEIHNTSKAVYIARNNNIINTIARNIYALYVFAESRRDGIAHN